MRIKAQQAATAATSQPREESSATPDHGEGVVSPLGFVHDDGGRKGSSSTGDCVPRAIAIATGLDYYEVLKRLNALETERASRARSTRMRRSKTCQQGTWNSVYTKFLLSLGWEKVSLPVWTPLDEVAAMVPLAIIKKRKHLVALVDGNLRDTWDSRFSQVYDEFGYPTGEQRVARIKTYFTPPRES